jgi:hypothetical protein
MPLQTPPAPFFEQSIHSFLSNAGTPGGARHEIVLPFRCKVLECGFTPAGSDVTSAITMAVAIGNQLSSTASSFTNIITSTLGTFASTNAIEGLTCSVVPPSASFGQRGDVLQFSFSGGQTSALGASVYAIIRRA